MATPKKQAAKKAAPKKAPAKKVVAKKPAPKAAPAKKVSSKLEAFDRTARKKVPLKQAQIAKKGNSFVATGLNKEGRVLSTFVSRDHAEAVVSAGGAMKKGKW